MKYLFSVVLASFLLFSCKSDDKKVDTASSNPDTPVAYEGAPENAVQVVGIGRVEPEQGFVELATQESGIVTHLYIREGDAVKAGQKVLELEQSVAQEQIAQVRARANTQQAQVMADEKAVKEAEVRLENLQKNLQRSQNLFDKKVETEQNRDNAQFEVRNQQASLERLRAALQVSKSRQEEYKSELLLNERSLALKTVKSPVSGRILSVSTQLGNALPPQSTFAEMAPDGKIVVRCEVDELLAGRVSIGQKAEIRVPGSNQALTEGEVIYTAPMLKKKSLFTEAAGEKEDRRVREVKILLNDPKNLLFNARVECVIKLK